MTWKSKRELERAVDDLDHGDSARKWADVQIVFVDSETGNRRTPDGEPVDPDAHETIMRIGGPPPEDPPGGRR